MAGKMLWAEIARRTFQSGSYNAENENAAHRALTGASVANSYLRLNGRYQLCLLGASAGLLPTAVVQAWMRWLWEKPEGIGYLTVTLRGEPPTKVAAFDRWLASLEMLADFFQLSAPFMEPAIQWLWEQRRPPGYWDFGLRPASSVFLPLSDGWRERDFRKLDWTTRILILLRKHYENAAKNPAA